MSDNEQVKLYLQYALLQLGAESYLHDLPVIPAERQAEIIRRFKLGFNDRTHPYIFNYPGFSPEGDTPLLPGQNRMVQVQAERLLSEYRLVQHHENDQTGFSAVLFRKRDTNEYVLSLRSLEFRAAANAGDRERDLDGAAFEIRSGGFAFGQLVAMQEYYQYLRAGTAETGPLLPADATLTVTGFSLGGHLATLFTLMNYTELGSQLRTYTYNAAGHGVLEGAETDGANVANMLSAFKQFLSDPNGTLANAVISGIEDETERYQLIVLRDQALARYQDEPDWAPFAPDTAGLGAAYENRTSVYVDPRYIFAVNLVQYCAPTRTLAPQILNLNGSEDGSAPAYGAITQIAGLATHDDRNIVANSQRHSPNVVRVFIEDQADLWGGGGISGDGDLAGNFGATHALVLIIDSLALVDVLQQAAPNLSMEEAEALLAAASNMRGQGGPGSPGRAEGDSLEQTLDALRRFLASPAERETLKPTEYDPVGDGFGRFDLRTTYYENLEAAKAKLSAAIASSGVSLVSYVTEVPSAGAGQGSADFALPQAKYTASQLFELAKSDLGHRVALAGMNPFGLIGEGLYPEYRAGGARAGELDVYDPASGLTAGALSLQWLADRAEFLRRKLILNLNNLNNDINNPLNSSADADPMRADATTSFRNENVLYADLPSGYRIDFGLIGAYRRILFGGEGADVAWGGDLDDRLYGGAGTDLLSGGADDDYLEGGSGRDLYQYSFLNPLVGNEANDGNDTIRDADGRGVIRVRELETVALGAPNETGTMVVMGAFMKEPGVANSFKSADGKITLVKQPAVDEQGKLSGLFDLAVMFNKPDGTQRPGTMTIKEWNDGDFGIRLFDPRVTPNFADTENIVPGGNDEANTLTGTGLADLIQAFGGADRVNAGGGDDIIEGGAGNDILDGQGENDQVYGEAGEDGVTGGLGDDNVYGGDGRDFVTDAGGSNLLEGNGGADIVYAIGAGRDELYADSRVDLSAAIMNGEGSGSGLKGDWLMAGADDDLVVGSAGNDVVLGGGGNDILVGGPGDDNIDGDLGYVTNTYDWKAIRTATPQTDGPTLYRIAYDPAVALDASAGGNDLIYAGSGEDWVSGGVGDDFVDAGSGPDKVWGDAGSDTLVGGAGNDILTGDNPGLVAAADEGGDYLDGGAGDDQLFGNGGDDILIGGAGNDLLVGGAGRDIYVFNKGDGTEIVLDTPAGSSDPEASILVLGDAVNRADIKFRTGSLFVDVGDGEGIHFQGFDLIDPQNTPLIGEIRFADGTSMTYADILAQGFDIDGTEESEDNHDATHPQLQGTGVTDRIRGLGGDDIILGLAGHDAIEGGEGGDSLHGQRGADFIDGGAGDDFLYGDGFYDVLGTPVLNFDDDGAADTLRGGDGNDYLNAAGGEDILEGGRGSDILIGGTGKDTYYFNAGDGADTLIDASTGADASVLVFGEGFDPSNLKVRLGSLVLDFGDAGSVTLPDFDPLDTGAPAPFDRLIFAGGSTLDYAGVQALGLYIDGTPGNDLLTGTAFGDHLSGLAGSDTLRGNTGNDELNGGEGYDTLEGGAGDDSYIYDTFDVINSDSQGANSIVYGVGITPELLTINEFFISGQSRLLIARPGTLGAGLEVRGAFMGTTGFVHVFSDGTVLTQAQLLPIAIRDARVINGNFFNNALTGFAGNDQISGGFGNDTLSGMAGDDVLFGGPDNDTLLGGVGNDQLSGDEGSDVLFGDAGNDNLIGGTGNDVLFGGPGNDTLTAGPGADVHLFGYGDGNDVIGAGVNIDPDLDTIHLADGLSLSDVTIAHEPSGDLTLTLKATGERITMTGWYTSGHSVERIEFGDGPFVDETELESLPVRPLEGTAGDDLLTGTRYEETVLGMAGADVLDGGRAHDMLQGGEGSDTYVLGWGTGRDTLIEQAGETSTVRLAPGMTFDDVRFAREGNDLFIYTRRTEDGLVLKDYYAQPHDWRIETASGASMTVTDFLALPAPTAGNAVTDLWEAQKTAIKTLWYTNTPGQVLTDGTIYAAPASAVSVSFTKSYFNGDIGTGTGGLPSPLVLGTETFSSFGAGALISSDAASQLYQLESRTSTTVRSTATFDIAWDTPSVSRGTYYQGTFIGEDGMWHSRYLVQVTPTLRGTIEGFTRAAYDGASTAQLEYAAVIGRALPSQVDAALDSVASSFDLTEVRAGGSDNIIEFNAFGMVDAGAGNDLIDSRGRGYYWNVASAGNFLYGGTGNDRITGSSAQDLISGGAGDDVLAGWADNDTYYFFAADAGVDIINEATRYLWEVVNAPQDNYQSGQLSEDTIEFGEGISLSGLTFSTGIYESRSTMSGGTTLYDTLDIFWDPGTGVRILMPDYFDPQVRSDIRSNPGRSWGVEQLQFADGRTITVQDAANAIPVQTLNGTAADDTLHGGAGRDAFFGGAGYDALEGGFGDDVYYFNLGDGEDWIYDYGGSDTVVFGAGITADMLSLDSSLFAGFWGSMRVRVGASDKLHLEFFRPTEALGQGQIETYRFADGSTLTHAQLLERGFDITGTESLDILNGTSLDDRMFGLAGDDRLDGLGGADRMAGGSGNDTYLNVDNPGDVVIENANEGIDTIESRIDYTLPDNVENLTLVGLEAVIGRGNALDNVIVDATLGSYWSNALYGEAGNDTLIGGPAGDSLFGGEGSDILDGGVGGDWMHGGPGDDVFFVDGQGDVVIENADEGTDSVFSRVGYSIPSYVENLTLTGTSNVGAVGNELDNILAGNAGNNNVIGGGGNDTMFGDAGNDFMTGDAGDDFIDGGLGSDNMFGGTGDDTFVVERTTDVVNESANAGNDTVRSSITYTLGVNVENLRLTGTAAINGTGNALANVITGNGADNVLDGMAGNDLLMGEEGSDSYRFNLGTGEDIIEEVDAQGNDIDSVLLGSGITTSNLKVGRTGHDIVLTVTGFSDRLTLRNWLAGAGYRIERTQFANGTVWDAATLESQATVLNSAPVVSASIPDQSADEDAQFLFSIPANTFTDPDTGDTLAYTALQADGTALPSWLTFDNATRTFSGTPLQGDVGSIDVRVTVTDSEGLSAQDTFTLSVANTNDAPYLANAIADQPATEDAAFSYTVAADTFADEDPGDTLTLGATRADGTPLPDWLAFDGSTHTFSGTPTNDDVGSLGVRVTAADGSDTSASEVFDITVANTNDAPIVAQAIADQTATEDEPFAFAIPMATFADVDADDTLALSASLSDGSALPTWLSFDGFVLSGTPTVGASYDIRITAMDAVGASAADVFHLDVANVNDGPVVANPILDQSFEASTIVTFAVPDGTFFDEDGDALTYLASLGGGGALPLWLSFNAATGTFSGSPLTDDIGISHIALTATDPSGASALLDFGLIVRATPGSKVVGDPNTNVLYGSTGDETIFGEGNDDALFGGEGNDILRGGTGNDVLQGEAGNDVLRAGNGNNVLDGGAGDDVIFDGAGDSFIAGGAGNDTIKMGTGNDIIAFNSGDGWDRLIGGGDGGNTLSLGGGIRYSDLSFSKVGNDLIVGTGQDEGIILNDWYAGSKSVLNLQIVLDASDTFDATSADPLYGRRVQTFDFLGLVSAFDQARMASPGLTSWDITNALLQWHLWGADDAALGGDLAYWYGRNRTLAAISLLAAQQVIGAAGFGSDAQSLRPFSGLQEGFVKLS